MRRYRVMMESREGMCLSGNAWGPRFIHVTWATADTEGAAWDELARLAEVRRGTPRDIGRIWVEREEV